MGLVPFDSATVNRLRGKSLVEPTGEDVRMLCRMLDWCELVLLEVHAQVGRGMGPSGPALDIALSDAIQRALFPGPTAYFESNPGND